MPLSWGLAAAAGAALGYLALQRLRPSAARWILVVFVQGMAGLLALGVWNRVFVHHGWGIGLNPVTGLTVGILGPPGFLLLVAVKVLVL